MSWRKTVQLSSKSGKNKKYTIFSVYIFKIDAKKYNTCTWMCKILMFTHLYDFIFVLNISIVVWLNNKCTKGLLQNYIAALYVHCSCSRSTCKNIAGVYICIWTVPFVLSNLLVHVCSTHFTVIPEHLFIKK